MKSIGILWNSMNEYRDEAIEYIKKYSIIEEIIILDLCKNFEKFIRDIYYSESLRTGFIDYKVSIMNDKYDTNTICILFLDVFNSEKIYIERKNKFLYKSVYELKQSIRNIYKDKIKNYSYDNIYHMTDDENEYVLTKNIINKYK